MKVINQVATKSISYVKHEIPRKNPNATVRKIAKQIFPISASIASTTFVNSSFNTNNDTQVKEPVIDKKFLKVLSKDLSLHKYLEQGDVYYLAHNFEYATAFVADLIMQKDDKNNLRILKKEAIEPIFEAYQINPIYTEKLVSEKDNNGEFRYLASEIRIMANLSVEMPEALSVARENPLKVEQLLNIENELGEKLYTLKDIEVILKLEESECDFGKELLNMKRKPKSKQARFTPEQVDYILKKNEDFPELTEILLKEKFSCVDLYRFEGDEVINILKATNDKNLKIVTTLIKSNEYYPNSVSTILEKKEKSEYDLLLYCAENYSHRLKRLLKTLEIESISEETFEKLKAYRRDEYRRYWLQGLKKVKAPLRADILRTFEKLVKSTSK